MCYILIYTLNFLLFELSYNYSMNSNLLAMRIKFFLVIDERFLLLPLIRIVETSFIERPYPIKNAKSDAILAHGTVDFQYCVR